MFRIEKGRQSRDGFLINEVTSYGTNWPRLLLIYDWPEEAVYKYVKHHNLKLNPLYPLIGHSGNCMGCPKYFRTYEKCSRYLERLRKFDQRWYNKLVHFLREYVLQRGRDKRYPGIRRALETTILDYV